MKRITIYYRMTKLEGGYGKEIETAETCIDLTMDEDIADDIFGKETSSIHFDGVRDVLLGMTRLQGYHKYSYVMVNRA